MGLIGPPGIQGIPGLNGSKGAIGETGPMVRIHVYTHNNYRCANTIPFKNTMHRVHQVFKVILVPPDLMEAKEKVVHLDLRLVT